MKRLNTGPELLKKSSSSLKFKSTGANGLMRMRNRNHLSLRRKRETALVEAWVVWEAWVAWEVWEEWVEWEEWEEWAVWTWQA